MKLNWKMHLFAAMALCCCTIMAKGDIKIKTKIDGGTESTTYIKGKRQRMEFGGGLATITQCDMKRTVQLNQPTKTYTVALFNQTGDVATTNVGADNTQREQIKGGGLVTSTITTKDTGERQQMFGFNARRIITSMVTESSPEACSQNKSRTDTDGWYIDFPMEFDCNVERATAAVIRSTSSGGCRDEYRTKQIGSAKLGYPVKVKMTFYDENNQPKNSYAYEVVELSKAPLDAALFDVPADYREVKNAQELYAAMAATSSTEESDASSENNPKSGLGANARELAVGKTTAASLAAKKEGVVRIGVVMTKTTSVGEGVDAPSLSEAVRNTVVKYLTGPAIEVVALDARLPVQIDAEAKQKECDYVVYTTAAHKKGKSGGFGSFLKSAAPVINAVPIGGVASSTAGAVATGVATSAIYTAASVAGSVKAKDELTLEYKLQNGSGSPVVAQVLKAKAKSDGDDLISQLVEQAAGAILNEATKLTQATKE